VLRGKGPDHVGEVVSLAKSGEREDGEGNDGWRGEGERTGALEVVDFGTEGLRVRVSLVCAGGIVNTGSCRQTAHGLHRHMATVDTLSRSRLQSFIDSASSTLNSRHPTSCTRYPSKS
jgi:hypothetical protein